MPSLYPDIVSYSHLSSLGSFKRGWVSHVDSLGGAVVKNLPANAGDAGDEGLIPEVGSSPGVENGNLFQYSPGKFLGQRSLVSYSTWGPKEADTTEHTRMYLMYTFFFPMPGTW